MRAPARVKTLTIDERDVGARDDQTILEVAREHGIAVPALCHLDGLSDVGACRLCLVEVKGARRLLPACTTYVEEAMHIITTSDTLRKYRRMIKEFPPGVDVTLVEGAVSSAEDDRRIRLIRDRTRILVSLGDCAVTANVPSPRNPLGVDAIMHRAYLENVSLQPQIPQEGLPALLPRVRPVHAVVTVDVFIPGCPPSADTIYFAMSELLAGRLPDFGSGVRFG